MNRIELKEILSEMAENDLEDGADIFEHPCTVAIRALDKAFADIDSLRKVVRGDTLGKSKKIKYLIGLPYNPSW